MAQLVKVVSAAEGTRAADVLFEIEMIRRRDPSLNIVCKLNVVEGLHLKSVSSGRKASSFSGRYEECGGVFYLRIGEKMPFNPRADAGKAWVTRAAMQIVAMIKRGREWKDKNGVAHREAYGPLPGANKRKICKPRRHRRRPGQSSAPVSMVKIHY